MMRSCAGFLIVVPCLIALSCKDEPVASGGGSPWLMQYPMEVGRQWNYQRILTRDNLRILDSTVYVPPETTMTFSVTVTITRTLRLPVVPGGSADSVLVTEFRTETDEPMVPENFDYYEQTPEALLSHGYIGGSVTTPRHSSSDDRLSVNGVSFRSVQELTNALYGHPVMGEEIMREYPPLTALVYPLIPDSSWTYRPDGDPFRIDKVVLSVKDSVFGFSVRPITIVQFLYDFDRNGTWDENISLKDYFSTEGLFRRVLEVKDVQVTSSQGPDPIALVDLKEELVLGGQQSSTVHRSNSGVAVPD